MNLIEYTPKALAFASFQPTQQDDLVHAALGLTSDVGELVEAIANHCQYGHDLDRVNAIEELGDTLWFANLAATVLGRSLHTAYIKAIEEHQPEGLPMPTKLAWVTIEAARVADQVKGHAIYGKALDMNNMMTALGSTALAVTEIAAVYDISLEEILDANIAKLTARYGDKFDQTKALNRDKGAEREAIQAAGA